MKEEAGDNTREKKQIPTCHMDCVLDRKPHFWHADISD